MLIDQATFQLFKNAIMKDGWLELPANGNSMYPFIQQGNICRFEPFEISSLKKGDILLFYSERGQLIAHRFYSIKKGKDKHYFLTKGDTNLGFDEPLEEIQIIGKLVSIRKNCVILRQENRLSLFWGKLIQAFPIISGFLRKYLNRKMRAQF